MYDYFSSSVRNLEPIPIIQLQVGPIPGNGNKHEYTNLVLCIYFTYKYFEYEYRVSGTRYRDRVEAKYRVSGIG